MAGLTTDQQAQLKKLQDAVTNATADYKNAVQAYANAVAAQEDCQSKRDQFTLGTKKNQACHIDTLNALSNATANAQRDRDAKESILATAQTAYSNYMNKLKEEAAVTTETNAAALAGDPNYQLTQQQNILTAQAQQLAASLEKQKEEERAKRLNNIIIVSSIVVGGIILIAVSIWAYTKLKNKEPKTAAAAA